MICGLGSTGKAVARKEAIMRPFLRLMVVSGVLLAGGFSCGLDVTTPQLKIVEETFVATEETAMVVGLAENTTDKDLKWPLIVVIMKDEEDKDIYIGADRVERLRPGETWRFEVRYLYGTAADYEIVFDHPLHFG